MGFSKHLGYTYFFVHIWSSPEVSICWWACHLAWKHITMTGDYNVAGDFLEVNFLAILDLAGSGWLPFLILTYWPFLVDWRLMVFLEALSLLNEGLMVSLEVLPLSYLTNTNFLTTTRWMSSNSTHFWHYLLSVNADPTDKALSPIRLPPVVYSSLKF